jgi:AcrR family transcriptional regulator
MDSLADDRAPAPSRPMRADARRNYERILLVAREAFYEHGAAASLDDIARRAEVGPGTLYRHFPTRSALLDMVYREHVREICAEADALAQSQPPFEALAAWLRCVAVGMTANQGLKEATVAESLDLSACKEMYYTTGGELVDRAQEAGTVRPGVDINDVLKLVHATTQGSEKSPDPIGQIDRLLSIVLDGLRTRTG